MQRIVLINDIHQARVQVEKLFEQMGGAKVHLFPYFVLIRSVRECNQVLAIS